MALNDSSLIARAIAALVGADRDKSADTRAVANAIGKRVIRKTVHLAVKAAADGAASTATAETAVSSVYFPTPFRVIGARYVPDAGVTADNTNNATINVNRRDGIGGAAAVAASLTTNVAAGNMVQYQPKPFTVSAVAGAAQGPANGILTFSIAKSGTGVVIPAGTLFVDIEEEGIDGYAA